MTREGYESYIMYLALQKHFSSNYDFFKYNGKVKASIDAYQKRNDVFSFEKLTKIVPQRERLDFFVSHFIDDPKAWIRSMSKTKWEEHKAKYKNFPKKFREDLEYIKLRGPSNLIHVKPDTIPEIHRLVMSNEISLESVIILDHIFPFMQKHVDQVTVPFVWPEYARKFEKYKPFVKNKLSDTINTLVDVARDVLLKT